MWHTTHGPGGGQRCRYPCPGRLVTFAHPATFGAEPPPCRGAPLLGVGDRLPAAWTPRFHSVRGFLETSRLAQADAATAQGPGDQTLPARFDGRPRRRRRPVSGGSSDGTSIPLCRGPRPNDMKLDGAPTLPTTPTRFPGVDAASYMREPHHRQGFAGERDFLWSCPYPLSAVSYRAPPGMSGH